MLRSHGSPVLYLIACIAILSVAIPDHLLTQAAERKIDLDGNAANGEESRIVTRVLQTYPVRVENVIYNNALGQSFVFDWPGAGPGGFDSFIALGPEVGTKWEWSTVSQVYSIETPIAFQIDSRGVPVFGAPPGPIQGGAGNSGVFMVPGKSIFPTQVTLSGASLTSSLVTFFSPEETIATCGGTFVPGSSQQSVSNNSGGTLTFNVEQPDCCPEPQMIICDDGCQFYRSDPQNCGGCAIECASDEFCAEGVCEPICPGQTLCGETCVDLLTDPQNCGGCGVECAADEFCSAGTCTPICPAGQTLCGETCVDLSTDVDNCGACGFQCDPFYRCIDGLCEPDCPAGQDLCGEVCVDLQTDPFNCGACGVLCAADEFCGGGICQPICPGQTLCGETCVDLQTDPLNCGACGNACGPNAICDGGACRTCRPPLQTACNNQCVNIHTDPFNCGACGNVCDFTDCPSTGTGTCSQGSSCICDSPEDGSTSGLLIFEPQLRSPRRKAKSSAPRRAAPTPALRLEALARARPDADRRVATESVRTLDVVEAPVCDIAPLEQTIPDGETFTQCLGGAAAGKEIFTIARVSQNGKIIGQGPCALIVPAPEMVIPPFLPSPIAVYVVDPSGDGLCQPGETCDLFIAVQNLGDAPFLNPVATLSSPPDAFNPLALSFLNATSAYPDFPAFAGAGDCDNPPQLDPQTNLMAFSVAIPAAQDPDVGRVFNLDFVGDVGTETAAGMNIVVGIGNRCDPAAVLDGETYDQLAGLLSPVDARLVPQGNPVNYSTGSFNQTGTIPLKLRLGCGSRILDPAEIDPNPEIVALVHETLGPQPLANINGTNGANPNNPFFFCGGNRCEYELRTKDLPVGRYVISVEMPDSRVFVAGFILKP